MPSTGEVSGVSDVPSAADSTRPILVTQPRDIQVEAGERAYMRCQAEGNPPPQITWYHNQYVIYSLLWLLILSLSLSLSIDLSYNLTSRGLIKLMFILAIAVTIQLLKVTNLFMNRLLEPTGQCQNPPCISGVTRCHQVSPALPVFISNQIAYVLARHTAQDLNSRCIVLDKISVLIVSTHQIVITCSQMVRWLYMIQSPQIREPTIVLLTVQPDKLSAV